MKRNLGKKNLFSSVLEKVKPSKQELDETAKLIEKLKSKLNGKLKRHKIDAEIFVGGSIAKNTIIRKERYDIDIFVRFSYKKYINAPLSDILEKILHGLKYKRIHGSRDYFHIRFGSIGRTPVLFEIVPVLKISKPQEARNVTDLSFFHVNYAVKKTNEKLADEIRLAKAFCYAQNCYGAESYIKGFSGYAVELLVVYFKSFMNLVKSAAKWGGLKKGGKVFIDLARHYKSKDEALLEINEAKLTSPIVLIDPTYAARNVTAAISDETFARFVHACKAFSAKPSIKFFEKKGVDARELEKTAARKKAQFSILKAESRKAKEDIAAAKLLKFSNFLVYFLEKNGFKILQKEIEFRKQQATIYLIYRKPSAEMIVSGPPVTIVGGVVNFKRKYKNAFVKNGMVYAKVKRKIRTIKDAISQIRKGDEIRDMGISKIEMLK